MQRGSESTTQPIRQTRKEARHALQLEEARQIVRAHHPNGAPVAANYDELSIAERATLIPPAWEYAEQRRVGGHGFTVVSTKVYNAPITRNGTSGGTFALVVLLVIAGFVVVSMITG